MFPVSLEMSFPICLWSKKVGKSRDALEVGQSPTKPPLDHLNQDYLSATLRNRGNLDIASIGVGYVIFADRDITGLKKRRNEGVSADRWGGLEDETT